MIGGLDLSFRFPRNGKIPYPHQATWGQPINMRLVRNKGKAEKPGMPKFEKGPRKFVPIELLCKYVTNTFKPAPTAYAYPINLVNSLSAGLSDPALLRWLRQKPWLESVINFPFFENCIVLEAFSLPARGFGYRAKHRQSFIWIYSHSSLLKLKPEFHLLTDQSGQETLTGAQIPLWTTHVRDLSSTP